MLFTEPAVADTTPNAPQVSWCQSRTETFLSLAYTPRKNAPDLVISVKAGANLQACVPLQASSTLDKGMTKTVTIQDSVPASVTDKRFLRLEMNVMP